MHRPGAAKKGGQRPTKEAQGPSGERGGGGVRTREQDVQLAQRAAEQHKDPTPAASYVHMRKIAQSHERRRAALTKKDAATSTDRRGPLLQPAHMSKPFFFFFEQTCAGGTRAGFFGTRIIITNREVHTFVVIPAMGWLERHSGAFEDG